MGVWRLKYRNNKTAASHTTQGNKFLVEKIWARWELKKPNTQNQNQQIVYLAQLLLLYFPFFAWFYTAIQQFLTVHPEIKDPRETQNISNHISREHDSFACTYLDKQNLNVAWEGFSLKPSYPSYAKH